MIDARTLWNRRVLRLVGRLLLRLCTRTTIGGQEHLAEPGPVIYAANHLSTFDALLLIALVPLDTHLVGPGDFKLTWPASWVLRQARLILMKRGTVDREGLKQMLDVLKAGQRLAMFPEGGTWEKGIDDVKSGVAYLSQTTGARLVPIGFGHTYSAWEEIAHLRRPLITVQIGPALPPVQVSGKRATRQDELQAAALDLMHHIYDLLPPATQAQYDRQARQRFEGALRLSPAPAKPHQIEAMRVSYDALAELVSKPNLFRPLHANLRLPVVPFQQTGRFFPAATMRIAAQALLETLYEGGALAGYIEYRLGDVKAFAIREALEAIVRLAAQPDMMTVRMAFEAAAVEEIGGDRYASAAD